MARVGETDIVGWRLPGSPDPAEAERGDGDPNQQWRHKEALGESVDGLQLGRLGDDERTETRGGHERDAVREA